MRVFDLTGLAMLHNLYGRLISLITLQLQHAIQKKITYLKSKNPPYTRISDLCNMYCKE